MSTGQSPLCSATDGNQTGHPSQQAGHFVPRPLSHAHVARSIGAGANSSSLPRRLPCGSVLYSVETSTVSHSLIITFYVPGHSWPATSGTETATDDRQTERSGASYLFPFPPYASPLSIRRSGSSSLSWSPSRSADTLCNGAWLLTLYFQGASTMSNTNGALTVGK